MENSQKIFSRTAYTLLVLAEVRQLAMTPSLRPTMVSGPEVELQPVEDAEEGPGFAQSCITADAAMNSLATSLTTSNVLAVTGSSVSLKKSRFPPREIIDRPGRSALSTPQSRGTRRSGVSPASTPSRNMAIASESFVSLMSRKSATQSIRSDPFGGVASTVVEQASAQLNASIQRSLTRDRQEYGPLIGQSRTSPRAVQISSMSLQLGDAQPPLPPPEVMPVMTEMEVHYEQIMRGLNTSSDEVAALSHQQCGQARTIQYTEAELRDTERRLFTEARQRDVAMAMASDVSTGQAEVFRQFGKQSMEQTAQACRVDSAAKIANDKVT